MPVRSARRRRRSRTLWSCGAAAVVAVTGFVAAALLWSGATLAPDAVALARVEVQPLGGTLESAHASGADGRAIPLSLHDGRLTPRDKLVPGERVSVDVVIRRPRWLGWLIGTERRERLSVRAPVAQLHSRWLTVSAGQPVRVAFDEPVTAVVYSVAGVTRNADGTRRAISLGRRAVTGTAQIAASARTWERLGSPVSVSWFPASRLPVLISSPQPGAHITPITPLRLTFSQPVTDVLGSARPTLTPSTRGRWRQLDSHTLLFVPAAPGLPFASELQLSISRPVAVRAQSTLHTTRRIRWTVPPGSTLRLQQLLAEAGYLPLDWTPAAAGAVPRTPLSEELAAIAAPAGSFHWRYTNIPTELRSLWSPGQSTELIRGAVMMFEHDHGLAADGLAGAQVWSALIADAIAGTRRSTGYSYVYVHRNLPQSLNLWHNGQLVLTSPGNTGVPAAPTQLGTFPVFEHIPVGTMSGRNPNGSHYHDPGIRYISYFNHGEAIHAFNRASFGTPQSLGCVELPLAAAAKVWPYTPIGTLVTVEN